MGQIPNQKIQHDKTNSTKNQYHSFIHLDYYKGAPTITKEIVEGSGAVRVDVGVWECVALVIEGKGFGQNGPN